MNYDIIIVGGGIAGLYTAYNALKKDSKRRILILEKSNHVGGRVHTNYDTFPTPLEFGAGRFHSGHRHVLNLIKHLGLQDKIKSMHNIVEPKRLNQIMKHIIDTYYSIKNTKDQELSLRDYVLKNRIITSEDYAYLESNYGYSAELVHMNMRDAMVLIKDMRSHNKYYSLQGGLSQIIQRLYQEIRKMGGKIKLNTQVMNIDILQDHSFLVKTNKTQLKASKCVLAIPKDGLLTMPIMSTLKNKLNSIVTTPLCRIYAQYELNPDGSTWFETVEKQAVSNKLRLVIPSNKEKGIIMISYTDDKYAKWWKNIYGEGGKRGKKQVMEQITKMTNETFGGNIPSPKDIVFAYWDAGVAFWRPGIIDSSKHAKDIMRPFGTEIDLYICGENYSPKQQWMESALITCPKL